MTYARTILLASTILGAALAIPAGGALAHTSTILDAPLLAADDTWTRVHYYEGTNPRTGTGTNRGWTDEIGPEHGFRTFQIGVDWSGKDVEITAYTNYALGGETIGGRNVPFADFAFDVDMDGVYEYGFDVDGGSSNGTLYSGLSTSLDANGRNSGGDWDTSVDAFGGGGFYYGGRWQDCNGTDCDLTTANVPLTEVVGGTADANNTDVAITDGGPVTLGGHTVSHAYSFVLSGVNASGNWDAFEIFWGTGACANDAIHGKAVVPIPAALPLILSAFAGLGFAGYRRSKQTA